MPYKQQKLEQLAGQVWKYVEKVWPLLERTGNLPELPMDRKSKGESNSPVGPHALALMLTNKDASRKLRPLLEELEKHEAAYGGYRFDLMLRDARYSSAAFVRWLSASNAGPRRRRAFWALCYLVARALVDNYGLDVELEVKLKPTRQEAVENPAGNPNRVQPAWRTITAHDGYRDIVERLERIRLENPHVEEQEAERLCQRELEELGYNGSIGRIRDAKTFCNRERGKTNGGRAA